MAAVPIVVGITLFGGLLVAFGVSQPRLTPGGESPEPSAIDASSIGVFGWFQGETIFRGDFAITGFRLHGGRLDSQGIVEVAEDFPALTPVAETRGALPFARGPFHGTILYGFTTPVASELHQVSISGDDDRLLLRSGEIIHDAVLDVVTGEIYYVELDRRTRHPNGIFALLPPGEPTRLVGPWAGDRSKGSQRHHVLVTPDGGTLAVRSCSQGACVLRAWETLAWLKRLEVAGVADRDILGISNDQIVSLGACAAPCPADALSLSDGRVVEVGSICHATGAVIQGVSEPELVTSIPIDGDCQGERLAIASIGLRSMSSRVVSVVPAHTVDVVPLDGWELPAGWFVVGPDGQLALDQPGATIAVRTIDGRRVPLPVR